MKTSQQLEQELGFSEAVGQFVAECEVAINQLDPELDYRRADLQGFVRACWPCEGLPIDVAGEFAGEIRKQSGANARIVFTGTWDWWQSVSQGEIEIGESLWDENEETAAAAAGLNEDDPESWVAPVTEVAERHTAIRVGDYAVCPEGIGGDVVFVRLS